MKKAIVLGGHDTSLGVIRALAKVDFKILCLYYGGDIHAAYSRFVSQSFRVYSPKDESEKLLEQIMSLERGWHGALLLACDDYAVSFLSQNRNTLRTRYIPNVPEWEIIKNIINKNILYLEAQRVGVPAPKVFFPNSIQSLMEISKSLSFPCILKPFQSPLFSAIYKAKVIVLRTEEELFEKYMDIRKRNIDVMVSEIIPGDDSALFHYRSYISREGDLLAEMCTQKLKQSTEGFGVASFSRTVPMIPEIRDMTLSLLKSLRFLGESSAEFKLDKRDNRYKLIEINVRPVLPERLLVAAGVNFPYIAYLDLVEGEKVQISGYEFEVYWVYDFFEALRLLRGKKLSLRLFLELYFKKRMVACIPILDDPIPFLAKRWKIMKARLRSDE